MAIEQRTVVCDCRDFPAYYDNLDFLTLDSKGRTAECPSCNSLQEITLDDRNFGGRCESCNRLWPRDNDKFELSLLERAIDVWNRKGWLLHETVIDGGWALLTLRRSV